jgi:AraC family ethanolamine operon transcriptional activator
MAANPVVRSEAHGPLFVETTDVHDINAMAACIEDGLSGEYVQLESGPFRARWTVLRLCTLVLQFSREHVATVQRLRVPEDRWAFVVPLSVPDGVRWDGQAVSQETLVVCPPRSESFVFHPGRTELAVVSVQLGAAPMLAASVGSGVELSSSRRVVRPSLDDLGSLASKLSALRSTAEHRPQAISRAMVDRAETLVRRALDGCLLGGVEEEAARTSPQSRTSIVRRVEEFFRDHVDETMSMTRLSTIAGVSERSLRNAFYGVCATSPKKYLRIWQLNQVRRSLQRTPVGSSSVTSVATQHGFYELGRFAGEYRALFGEAPSETLQKARLRPSRLRARWPVVPAS